uniref:Uncharacterized protein n=1 Tax=Plectus sambesii TaxID=2011161 RepID=A0A914WZ59_9BILA
MADVSTRAHVKYVVSEDSINCERERERRRSKSGQRHERRSAVVFRDLRLSTPCASHSHLCLMKGRPNCEGVSEHGRGVCCCNVKACDGVG